MAINETAIFRAAVREFWQTRERQAAQQHERGTTDQGARAAVTGGQQMDGFVRTLTELMIASGVQPEDIYSARRTTILPGFYRSTKEWDLVVVSGDNLLAAIELKSQIGPSFGNNFNNRTEEAMGSALDIWTAYREGAFRTSPSPWLGYLLLLEDCDRSQRPVGVLEPHFNVFNEFRDASYARRYEIFCRKLVRERQYNGACFIMSNREIANNENNYTEPAADLSVRLFISQLLRHVAPN